LGEQMSALREEILSEWGRRVREEVEDAQALSEPVLVNTLPAFFDNVAELLAPDYPRATPRAATLSVAGEHGGERARLTAYQLKSLVMEYQCLRATFVEVLRRRNAGLSQEQIDLINSAIDESIREATSAFVLAQAAFRERFFAALAHDLRGPLSSASMAAQLILRTGDMETASRHARTIVTNIGRVDEMIKEMLDAMVFDHGEHPRMRLTHFDLAELVREVVEQMKVVHGRRFEVEGEAVAGWWGYTELRRALENLLSNAIKYGSQQQPVLIRYRSEHGRAQLAVHNEGDAIPAAQQETVFQVFRRAEAARQGDEQGWGIGLPYVRTVAESHGGSIEVDSSPGDGTTFTIDMPIDARPFQHAGVLEPQRIPGEMARERDARGS
jgi:signal transduction histidine kinase